MGQAAAVLASPNMLAPLVPYASAQPAEVAWALLDRISEFHASRALSR